MMEKINNSNVDVAIIGYAVNSTSGGYTNSKVKYIDTVGIKYLYSHFYETYCAEPVAFLQLAAQLRYEGLSVNILDGLLLGYDKEEMKEKLKEINTKIFCFSLYESSKKDVIELMQYIKALHPESTIITGGPYVTLCYSELIRTCPIIDYIIIADSDKALPILIKALINGFDTYNIPNVIWRNRKGLAQTGREPEAVDLNELQPLERDFEQQIRKKDFSFSIVTSRGCGHAKCSFCYLPEYQRVGHQPKFRYRDPDLVVDEIKNLIKKYKITKLTVVDDDFFGTNSKGVNRAISIFKKMVDENIYLKLYVNTRVSSIKYLMKTGGLDLAEKAGLRYVFIGFESYNDDILKKYKKGITVQDIDDVCEELEKRNISINPGLITFDADITIDQVKRNIDLYHKIHYYDAFMFTRTLMTLPSNNKVGDNQVITNYFKYSDTAKLFYALKEFRDHLYPMFEKVDKNRITNEIREEIISLHYEFFYKVYEKLKKGQKNEIEIFASSYIAEIKQKINRIEKDKI